MKVTHVASDKIATVELQGTTQQVSTTLVPHVQPGDYVMIHAGYAISTVDEAEALETIQMIEEMMAD